MNDTYIGTMCYELHSPPRSTSPASMPRDGTLASAPRLGTPDAADLATAPDAAPRLGAPADAVRVRPCVVGAGEPPGGLNSSTSQPSIAHPTPRSSKFPDVDGGGGGLNKITSSSSPHSQNGSR